MYAKDPNIFHPEKDIIRLSNGLSMSFEKRIDANSFFE